MTRSRVGHGLGALACGLLLALVLPGSPAFAHAALTGSYPAAGSVVPDSPNLVILTFTESVRPVDGRVQVLAPDNSRADDGRPVAAGDTVTINLTARTRGTYLVSYRVVSVDSHPSAGSFTYSVGAPSVRSGDPAAAAGDTVAGPVRAAGVVVKAIGYAGLLLTVGPVLVLTLLWPRRLSRAGPTRLVWIGLGLAAGSTVAALYLQAPAATGGGLTDVTSAALRAVLDSWYGAVLLVRLGVICAAVPVVRPVLARGGLSRVDRIRLGGLGAAAVVTWPLTGHPIASPVPDVSIVVDAVHLAGMTVWLGGLVMLIGFLVRRADDRELHAILPTWSRWATTAVTALLLPGILQALIELGTFPALVTTSYGRLLVAKATLVAVVLAVATYSRRLVRHRPPVDRRAVRRSVGVELGIATAILTLTAVLGQTPPARTVAAPPAARNAAQVQQTLRNDTLALQVTVFPASAGTNTLHLYAYTPDNKPLPVVAWRATAALPAAGIEPTDVALRRVTDNHAIGTLSLPVAGDWRLRFTLRTSDVGQSTVTESIRID